MKTKSTKRKYPDISANYKVKIRKNIPIPSATAGRARNITNRTRVAIEAMKKLKVGESMLYPTDGMVLTLKVTNYIQTKISYIKREHCGKMKLTVRVLKTDKGKFTGIGIWRVK